MKPRLAGPRVELVPVLDAHRAPLRALHAHPNVARFWHAPPAAFPDEWEQEHGWSVLLAGEVIGYVQTEEEDEWHYRSASLDIFVGAAHQGVGLGTEALRVVCAHLVDDRGHHRLTIDPDVDNQAARRSYEKVGFRAIGIARQATRFDDGTLGDALLMDLLAAELVRA